jgi:hypothetical protein
MYKNEFETRYLAFRSVYKIAKRRGPFCDLPDDKDVQMLNGINVGRVFHSAKSCADVVKHIAGGMKKKSAEKVVTNKRKISVLVDE